jgi:glycosyltransferase involved in cell wall biosynthesis
MSDPSVTVVIPCFNAERWIGRAVGSVQAQQDVEAEIIVVDDGSTDRSVAAVEALGAALRLETGPNGGAGAARNKGLALARAPKVMFLDADDFLEPGALASLSGVLTRSEADLAIGRVIRSGAAGARDIRPLPRLSPRAAFVADWITGRFVPPCGVLWRRDYLRGIGGWDATLAKNQDGEIVLRAVLSGARIAATEEACAVYWSHDGTDRISNTFTEPKLRDAFGVLCRTRDALLAQGGGDAESEAAFSKAMHGLERHAFRNGIHGIGREIGAYRAAAGFPPFEGTRGHVLASRIVGVGRKERLANAVSGLLGGRT